MANLTKKHNHLCAVVSQLERELSLCNNLSDSGIKLRFENLLASLLEYLRIYLKDEHLLLPDVYNPYNIIRQLAQIRAISEILAEQLLCLMQAKNGKFTRSHKAVANSELQELRFDLHTIHTIVQLVKPDESWSFSIKKK